MKFKILAAALMSAVVLSACNGNSTNEENSFSENEPKNIKELVHDYSVGNIENASASITSTELIVTESDGKEQSYALPEDEFFVSIAPYINETHP